MKKNTQILPSIKTNNTIQGSTPNLRKKSNSISNLIKQAKYNNISYKFIKTQKQIKSINHLKLQPLTGRNIITDQSQKIQNHKSRQIYTGQDNIKHLSYHTKIFQQVNTDIFKLTIQSLRKRRLNQVIEKNLMTQTNQEEKDTEKIEKSLDLVRNDSFQNFKHYYSKSIQRNGQDQEKQKQKNEYEQIQIQISPWKIDNENCNDVIFQSQI